MYLVLIILLIVIVLGGWPGLGINHSWGYAPVGIGGLILLVLIVLLLAGRL